MPEFPTFEKVLWGVTFLLNTGLVALLVYRRSYRVFPFFFLYLLLNLLEAFVLFVVYQAAGFFSRKGFQVAWTAQGVVSLARAVAVAEICYLALGKFRGVWRLAYRLLLAAAALLAALYMSATALVSWHFALVNIDRGLELLIATVTALLFVFVRYYGVDLQSSIRTLAIGFFLYSDFRVLNDSILERLWRTYTPLWNRLGTLTFLTVLLLWSWALSHKLKRTALEPTLLPEEHYDLLSPAINARLKNLNECLDHFWDAPRKKT